jgi:hypothetical protein
MSMSFGLLKSRESFLVFRFFAIIGKLPQRVKATEAGIEGLTTPSKE